MTFCKRIKVNSGLAEISTPDDCPEVMSLMKDKKFRQ